VKGSVTTEEGCGGTGSIWKLPVALVTSDNVDGFVSKKWGIL